MEVIGPGRGQHGQYGGNHQEMAEEIQMHPLHPNTLNVSLPDTRETLPSNWFAANISYYRW